MYASVLLTPYLMDDALEPMTWRARIFVALLGVAVLVYVMNLVRTRKLKEEYAILWLFVAAVLVIAPFIADWLDTLAWLIGVEYAPALIFMLAIIIFLFIFFQFSVSISRFSEQIKVLTQDIALLRRRIEELEARESKEG